MYLMFDARLFFMINLQVLCRWYGYFDCFKELQTFFLGDNPIDAIAKERFGWGLSIFIGCFSSSQFYEGCFPIYVIIQMDENCMAWFRFRLFGDFVE